MALDRIIAEVRQVRDELAERFNYDLHAIILDAQKRQAAGGRKVVTLPPRPARQTTGKLPPTQPLPEVGQTPVAGATSGLEAKSSGYN